MTKAEIRTAFLSILNNTACTNALADTFIDEGFTRSQRLLKLPAQEAIDITTVGDSFEGLDIPNDFMRLINIYYDQQTLKRISLGEYLKNSYGAGTTNTPTVFCRSRNKFLIGPVPAEGVELTMHYLAEFEDFASDSDETALSAIAPDLFIYGGLTYAADRFIDERKSIWEQRYQQIIIELQALADEDELSGEATIALPEAYKFPIEDY